MAIQIKSKADAFPTGEAQIYAVPANKAAIVKNLRLVNTHTTQASTVNLYIKRGTATKRSICQVDLPIAAKAAYIDDKELTLQYVDASNIDEIRGASSGGTVEYVLSYIERDV